MHDTGPCRDAAIRSWGHGDGVASAATRAWTDRGLFLDQGQVRVRRPWRPTSLLPLILRHQIEQREEHQLQTHVTKKEKA